MKENLILEKSYAFAVRVVRLYQYLSREQKEFVLSKQVLRSGTSIGANLEEADGAISKKEFFHKVTIAFKEAKETRYWLRLLRETDYLPDKLYNSLFNDIIEIIRILGRTQKTMREKYNL